MKTSKHFQKVESPIIGRMYHVAWAKSGCCWNLISINDDSCIMRTPKSKKNINVKISDLREIKKHSI